MWCTLSTATRNMLSSPFSTVRVALCVCVCRTVVKKVYVSRLRGICPLVVDHSESQFELEAKARCSETKY